MKTCKSFFHKSLIITSQDELQAACDNLKMRESYGFCLVSCVHRDYRAQRIFRFTDSYSLAYAWLSSNADETGDICGVVLGSEL